MDFIMGFSKTDKFRSIMVDRFSKYETFISVTKECPTEETTRLFLKYVVKYWGVPFAIVSDQDGQFTRRFWTGCSSYFGHI